MSFARIIIEIDNLFLLLGDARRSKSPEPKRYHFLLVSGHGKRWQCDEAYYLEQRLVILIFDHLRHL